MIGFRHFHWDEDETEIFMSVADEGSGYRVRFPGIGDYFVSPGQGQIQCQPFSAVPAETLRHLLLDQVVPRMLGQGGELVLHASAVELDDGTGLAFVGPSGAGKSTLASSFQKPGRHTAL